jgi:hypothetical protein
MKILEPSSYLDLAKLPSLIELVENFCNQPISTHLVDVGLKDEGIASNYSAVVIYDITGESVINDELAQLVQPITAYSRNINDLNRIFVNFLNPNSTVPVHLENPTLPEYNNDVVFSYNIIVPVTTHGSHIIDNTTLVSVKGSPIIFNGQVPHGTINNSTQTHIWVTMIVDSSRFIN